MALESNARFGVLMLFMFLASYTFIGYCKKWIHIYYNTLLKHCQGARHIFGVFVQLRPAFLVALTIRSKRRGMPHFLGVSAFFLLFYDTF